MRLRMGFFFWQFDNIGIYKWDNDITDTITIIIDLSKRDTDITDTIPIIVVSKNGMSI